MLPDECTIDARAVARLEDERRRQPQAEAQGHERRSRQEPGPPPSRPRPALPGHIWARVWRWGPMVERLGRVTWPGEVAEFPVRLLDAHPGVLTPIDT